MTEQNVQKPKKKKFKLHYSMLTIVLLICIIELVVSNVQNISKNIHYSAKIKGLEKKRNEELSINKQLKSEIENYNSQATLESIARNNLKMSSEDEVLVIINTPKEEDKEEKHKKGLLKHD